MSQKPAKFSLPSLAQHFDAPDDYVGHFGWLCGYSADAAFLNEAVERFTRLTSAQRRHQGRIALAVFLDPGNPAISLLDAPAVAHLPIKSLPAKPFRLLHAKVALLGFRHQQENSERWRLRLIVSTGNWTRQTLEQSLDLAWRVDFSSDALQKPEANIRQIAADITAASVLMQWIGALFDTSLLDAASSTRFSETQSAIAACNAWIASCARIAKGKPRFFDNRNQSLLAQLPAMIKSCGTETSRNYLAMGSGFYETATVSNRVPEVPGQIIKALQEKGLLTKSAALDLYVNPLACQSIAGAVDPLAKAGITVRKSGQPGAVFGIDRGMRSLHAKFLFSANWQKNSAFCNSSWVYLGSGNLTHPGFSSAIGANAGNLEAGVVFSPENMLWKGGKRVDPQTIITNLLPIQWEDEVTASDAQLQPGPGMEAPEDFYVAPLISWLSWHGSDSGGELRTVENVDETVQVLNSTGLPCHRSNTGFLWPDAQPRQVRMHWSVDGQRKEATIPVVDQYGRIAATTLPSIGIDEAWWQLADFPLPSDEDVEERDDDGSDHDDGGAARPTTRPASSSSYPIRQMMALVESIAAKQTAITAEHWPLWCNRLEQILGQAKDHGTVKEFIALGLNPLSPLRHAPFRPTFAETNASLEGKLCEDTLTRIETLWGVQHLTAIGETP